MSVKGLLYVLTIAISTCSGTCFAQETKKETNSATPERPGLLTPEMDAALQFLARSNRAVTPAWIYFENLSFIETTRNSTAFTSDTDVIHLLQFPRLRSLTIEGGSITGKALATIGKIKTLESLTLERLAAIKNADLAYLSDLNLELLSLNDCMGIDSNAIEAIAKLHVKEIHLSGTSLTLIEIARLRKLRPNMVVRFDPDWIPNKGLSDR